MPLQQSTLNDIANIVATPEEIEQYKKILKTEAEMLIFFIKKNINEYLNQYTPNEYKRKGKLVDSMKVGKISVSGNIISLVINFNSGATKKSFFSNETIFMPMALETGWKVEKDVWFKNTERMGYNPAKNIITKSIEQFKKKCKYNVMIEIHWEDGGNTFIYKG